VKRIEKNKMCDNQSLDYPDQDIKPLNPDEVDVSKSPIFRFRWASDNIDNILRAGLVCYDYLDIGACDGYMAVVVAKKKNNNDVKIHVDALEPHKQSFGIINETAKLARNAGLDVVAHVERFEDYKTDKRYDIITAFEILEHSKDPVVFLDKIYGLLKVGGTLMLTVPEENGTFGKTDDNPYHYWLFNTQSLVQMFDEKRWRIFQVFEIGDLIHIIVQRME
jgi:2-polyprenyl-3-methyl-5-hydroxy-6-metoxy-1,4-benzoquinol methylase